MLHISLCLNGSLHQHFPELEWHTDIAHVHSIYEQWCYLLGGVSCMTATDGCHKESLLWMILGILYELYHGF